MSVRRALASLLVRLTPCHTPQDMTTIESVHIESVHKEMA